MLVVLWLFILLPGTEVQIQFSPACRDGVKWGRGSAAVLSHACWRSMLMWIHHRRSPIKETNGVDMIFSYFVFLNIQLLLIKTFPHCCSALQCSPNTNTGHFLLGRIISMFISSRSYNINDFDVFIAIEFFPHYLRAVVSSFLNSS